MARLIYFTPTSLDGYIADDGNYEWSKPDEDVFAFINELFRPIGTHLYGRRNYETMAVWQTPEVMPGLSPVAMDFARIWQAADKIVYSRSLETVSTPKTRLDQDFNFEAVRNLKTQLPHDACISGPTLAAEAIRAGLVDEYRLLVAPAMLGRGIRILPNGVRLNLDLLNERRFANGMVYLRYRAPSL